MPPQPRKKITKGRASPITKARDAAANTNAAPQGAAGHGGDTKNSKGAPAFKTVELSIEFRFELETELNAEMPQAAPRHRAKACRRSFPPGADAVHPKPLTLAQPRTCCVYFRAPVAVGPPAYFWRIFLRPAGALWEARTPPEKFQDPASRKTSAHRILDVFTCGILLEHVFEHDGRRIPEAGTRCLCG